MASILDKLTGMRSFGIARISLFYFIMGLLGVYGIVDAYLVHGRLPVDQNWSSFAQSSVIGLFIGLSLVALSRVLVLRFHWARILSEEFKVLLGPLNKREIALLAGLSGVAEELLFRGVLQPALGLWLASAIFGLVHVGPNRRFLPWTLMAAVAGLCFGGALHITGSLVAPVVAHFTINYLNLRHLVLEKDLAYLGAARCS